MLDAVGHTLCNLFRFMQLITLYARSFFVLRCSQLVMQRSWRRPTQLVMLYADGLTLHSWYIPRRWLCSTQLVTRYAAGYALCSRSRSRTLQADS